jgi:hypothetical protein
MKRKLLLAACCGALAAASGLAAAQTLHSKVAQRNWDPMALEGRCVLRLNVDDRALVRLQGDDIWVETVSGDRAFDEGSSCNQPLPYGARDFRVTYERGRGRVLEIQDAAARRDGTRMIEVHDPQNGAEHYVISVAWTNPRQYSYNYGGNGYTARSPSAGFDPSRACQEQVRAEFVRRNGGDAYLEFNGGTGREILSPDRARVYGEAFARNRASERQVNYECVLNDRTLTVENIAYTFEGPTRGAMR